MPDHLYIQIKKQTTLELLSYCFYIDLKETKKYSSHMLPKKDTILPGFHFNIPQQGYGN